MFRSYSGSKDRREDDIWLQLTIVHLFTLDTHSKLLAFMNLKIKIKENTADLFALSTLSDLNYMKYR